MVTQQAVNWYDIENIFILRRRRLRLRGMTLPEIHLKTEARRI
jgi:hypothetical protein